MVKVYFLTSYPVRARGATAGQLHYLANNANSMLFENVTRTAGEVLIK